MVHWFILTALVVIIWQLWSLKRELTVLPPETPAPPPPVESKGKFSYKGSK